MLTGLNVVLTTVLPSLGVLLRFAKNEFDVCCSSVSHGSFPSSFSASSLMSAVAAKSSRDRRYHQAPTQSIIKISGIIIAATCLLVNTEEFGLQ